jgi:hypothetical protein
MSLEVLLLLILFIIVPLVQQWVRAAQARARQTATPPIGSPGAQSVKVPPSSGVSRPSAPAVLRTAAQAPRGPQATRMRQRTTIPPSDTRTPSIPPQRTRAHHALMDLRDPSALRRAVVLMAILAPCRAARPHRWPVAD